MSKEGFTQFEEEPIKESEITCDYCGPIGQAAWEVIMDESEVLYVCHKHHTRLLEKNVVSDERRIGEETWEEVEDYRMLLTIIDMENMEREGAKTKQFDVKPAIKKHQESAEWEYRDEAIFWNSVSQKMDERFFNGFLYPDGKKYRLRLWLFRMSETKKQLHNITFFRTNTASPEKLHSTPRTTKMSFRKTESS